VPFVTSWARNWPAPATAGEPLEAGTFLVDRGVHPDFRGALLSAAEMLRRPGCRAVLAGWLHVVIGSAGMNVLSGAPSQPGVLVQAAGDRSMYLLDPPTRRVLRYAPTGRLLQTLVVPSGVVGLPVDLAVDERRGLVVLADATFNQLVVMPLLGGSAYPVIPRGADVRLASIASVAPRLLANEASNVPTTRPNTAPASSVMIAAPGSESAATAR